MIDKTSSKMVLLDKLEPISASIDLTKTALIIIDMQRDFLEPGKMSRCRIVLRIFNSFLDDNVLLILSNIAGGFGSGLGNDVTKLRRAIAPCQAVLDAARKAGILIIHTREGHRADLMDLHPYKKVRLGSDQPPVIGEDGPFGKILVRGEPGHDIIESLYPQAGEPIIDKPGKGSFCATDLECILKAQQIEVLLVCGVTTEVCVHTTIREANDRGYYCIVVSDACASYFDDFHKTALSMVIAQGGIFGSVTDSATIVSAFSEAS
jgi:nicotinamidase-related amidase